MGISLIKKINEKTPYWVKKPFSKIIRNRLIRNSEFLKTYSQLCDDDLMNAEELKKKQLLILRGTLSHAYNHTVYYHKLFDDYGIEANNINSIEELKKIPVLTQELLKNNLDKISANDIEDFYLVTTGGTTGKPIKVQMEKKAIYREWAFVYHYWSKFGYDFRSSKLATLRGVNLGNKLYEINPLYAEIRLNPFTLSEKNIDKYIDAIDFYGADLIYGYPSAVYNFCRIAEKKSIDLFKRFKCAFLISENLYKFQEDKIREILGCNIAIFYGHSERAVFAEKYGTGYTFNESYGVTEFNENNEPVVTGFINGKTPLIRYVVDDKVEVNENGIQIYGHRDKEVLLGNNGQQISCAAINFHNETFEKVTGYQFIQDKPGECILNIVSDNISEKDISTIENQVNQKIGMAVCCKVQLVDELQLTSRGKYKMIIQNCNL